MDILRSSVLPICVGCKHLVGGVRCKAYPGGIPREILRGNHDHREPFAGDGGMRFDPIKGGTDGKGEEVPGEL